MPARLRSTVVIAFAVLQFGCAQTSSPDAQRRDADLDQVVKQAMGREISRAPAQIQFPAVPETEPSALADEDRLLPALTEAKTFAGTIPCQETHCQTLRISLTLAPSGHWRASNTRLAPQPSDTAEQGCWIVLDRQPARILLLTAQGTVRADLSFDPGQTLRVHAYNGVQPILPHRLTQQAEIDPIEALHDHPLLDCAPIYTSLS